MSILARRDVFRKRAVPSSSAFVAEAVVEHVKRAVADELVSAIASSRAI
ncbi:hypothetical protein [Sorangium sp. So ce1151]